MNYNKFFNSNPSVSGNNAMSNIEALAKFDTWLAGQKIVNISAGESQDTYTPLTFTKENGETYTVNIPTVKGDSGIAATISIGSVTTGEADSQASVTNVGNENAAILNFSIPKGKDGRNSNIFDKGTWVSGKGYNVGDLVKYSLSDGSVVTYKSISDIPEGSANSKLAPNVYSEGWSVFAISSSGANRYLHTISLTNLTWNGKISQKSVQVTCSKTTQVQPIKEFIIKNAKDVNAFITMRLYNANRTYVTLKDVPAAIVYEGDDINIAVKGLLPSGEDEYVSAICSIIVGEEVTGQGDPLAVGVIYNGTYKIKIGASGITVEEMPDTPCYMEISFTVMSGEQETYE